MKQGKSVHGTPLSVGVFYSTIDLITLIALSSELMYNKNVDTAFQCDVRTTMFSQLLGIGGRAVSRYAPRRIDQILKKINICIFDV